MSGFLQQPSSFFSVLFARKKQSQNVFTVDGTDTGKRTIFAMKKSVKSDIHCDLQQLLIIPSEQSHEVPQLQSQIQSLEDPTFPKFFQLFRESEYVG